MMVSYWRVLCLFEKNSVFFYKKEKKRRLGTGCIAGNRRKRNISVLRLDMGKCGWNGAGKVEWIGVITFKNVSKVYGNGTHALENVNMQVDPGEFVFIVGSSGAGKSTFLKLIMCEERPSEGKILVNNTDITNIRKARVPYLRRTMGIVFQDFRLIDSMNVYDNVAFAMHVVGATPQEIRRRVPYMLSLVNLQEKAKCRPGELSGGEQQRVGLARALINNPKLIIADEPTGNVDPALSFEIVELLSEINRRGTTILMVTHEHGLVKHFHRRIVEIQGGHIVADTGKVETDHETA